MFRKLWNDEAGFIVSAELVLIATILVIGMIVGLVTIRDQVVQELADVAGAISQINQSYSFSGVTGHTSRTMGSRFQDNADFCDAFATIDPDAEGATCIDVTTASSPEGTSP